MAIDITIAPAIATRVSQTICFALKLFIKASALKVMASAQKVTTSAQNLYHGASFREELHTCQQNIIANRHFQLLAISFHAVIKYE